MAGSSQDQDSRIGHIGQQDEDSRIGQIGQQDQDSRIGQIGQRLSSAIKTVQGFPRPEIAFKDLTPVCADPDLLLDCSVALAKRWQNSNSKIDYVAGIESRGFIFGPLVAQHLNSGFIPVRKSGKLPRQTYSIDYELEYGTSALEVHQDAARRNQKILLIDDLLATGGTAQAAISLLEQTEAEVVGCGFVVDLEFLQGREKLGNRDFLSLLTYT